MNKHRNAWLDGCRSLAIILVLMSHGRHFLAPAWEQAAVFRVGGFLGVELFFVLSGFLVGRILKRGFMLRDGKRNWLKSFLVRRWLRTLPVFYLFLAVNAILIALKIAPGHLNNLPPLIFFIQNLAWPGPSEFGEAWSLSVEEVFYVVLPIGLFLGEKLNPDRRRVFVLVSLALLLIPMLARAIFVGNYSPTWDDGVRKVVLFRLDSLMLGVLAGWLEQESRLLGKISGKFLFSAALISIGLVVVIYFQEEAYRDVSYLYRIWLFPITSFSVALLLLAGIRIICLPRVMSMGFERLARWSYALYLGHMPIFYLILHFAGPSTPHPLGALLRWLLFIAGSLAIAVTIERFVERPILAWRDRVTSR